VVQLCTHRIFQPTPDQPLDFELTIESYLLNLQRSFQVRRCLFDPFQMQSTAQRLQKAGLEIEEFPQSSPNLTAASQNLFELIDSQALVVYPDQDIRLAMSRAVAIETPRGWRIGKDRSSHKIDVVVALAMACHAAVQGQKEPYFDRTWSWVNDSGPIGSPPQSEEQRQAQARKASDDWYAARLQVYLQSHGLIRP
jgi:phage terminase large subunit-like protein